MKNSKTFNIDSDKLKQQPEIYQRMFSKSGKPVFEHFLTTILVTVMLITF